MFDNPHAVVIKGHFRLSSQVCSEFYVDKLKFLSNPYVLQLMSVRLALTYRGRVDTVIGPAQGGAIVAFALANSLSTSATVHNAWAEKIEGGVLAVRYAFAPYLRGKRVLLVDDVLTTGSALRAVRDLVVDLDGEIVGAAAVFNRGLVTAKDLGVPELVSVYSEHLPVQQPCPQCEANVPFTLGYGHA